MTAVMAGEATTSSVAAIITAIGTLVTAVAILITAVALWRSGRKTQHKVDEVTAKVGGVHSIVNQQHTDLLNYQAALMRALRAAGVPIPEDQSSPDQII